MQYGRWKVSICFAIEQYCTLECEYMYQGMQNKVQKYYGYFRLKI